MNASDRTSPGPRRRDPVDGHPDRSVDRTVSRARRAARGSMALAGALAAALAGVPIATVAQAPDASARPRAA